MCKKSRFRSRRFLTSNRCGRTCDGRPISLKTLLPLLTLASLPAGSLLAQTLAEWDGSDGSWTEGARWSSTPAFPADGQPAPGDTWDARIGAGNVTLDTVLGVQRLTLAGGTLGLRQSGALAVAAGFDWTGGTLSGQPDSPLGIGAGGTSTWSGTLTLERAHVLNSGSITLADGVEVLFEADFDSDAGLRNEAGGVLTLAGAGAWRTDWFGEGPTPDSLRNAGTLNKNGAGTFVVGPQEGSSAPEFKNSGMVNVDAGTLELEVRANSSGVWNIAEGARLVMAGATTTGASVFQGAGDVDITGSGTISGVYAVTGTTTVESFVDFNTTGATTFTDLVMGPSASLSGAVALSATGSLEWSGTISGSVNTQTFTLGAGATGVIPAGRNATLSRRTFNNDGALTWTGGATPASSIFGFNGNAIFNNRVGATFTAAGNGNGGTQGQASSTTGTFNNAGDFVKSGAGTTTRLNWTFANTGTVSVESGRLEIGVLSTAGGTYEVDAGGSLLLVRNSSFNVSGFNFSGSYAVAEGGVLEFSRGDLQNSATFSTGAGTVAFTGDMLIRRDSVPATTLRFAGRTGILAPSGTFTAGKVELVTGGILAPSGAGQRVRITDTLAWSGGFVGGTGPFPAEAGGTVELAAGSSTVLSGTGQVGAGKLEIDGAFQFQTGSQLQVQAAGVVEIGDTLTVGDGASLLLSPSTSAAQDATIRGGALTTTGSGVLRVGTGRITTATSSYGTLDGVAFDGVAELHETQSRLRLINGASARGEVRFTAATPGNFTSFELHQDAVLDGLTLADTTAAGNAKAVVAVIGNRTVTLGATSVMNRVANVSGDFFEEGTSNVIETGLAHFINEGRIATDGAGRSTQIALFETFENRGVLEATDGAQFFADRSFTQTAGRITIGAESTFTMSNPAYRASTRTLTLEGGVLEGAGTFAGNVVLAGGVIAPGESPGLLTIQGDLTASSGDFVFELGGTVRGLGYDALDVTGLVNLGAGGFLELSFVDGFEDSVAFSDTFSLITGGSVAGEFLNVADGERLFTLGGEGSFLVTYGADNLTLSGYVAAIPEPSAFALLLGGASLGGALLGRHGRRSALSRA